MVAQAQAFKDRDEMPDRQLRGTVHRLCCKIRATNKQSTPVERQQHKSMAALIERTPVPADQTRVEVLTRRVGDLEGEVTRLSRENTMLKNR